MAYRCLNHPERDAIGVCVKCRKYVCVECATKIEGVNYCAGCLPRARQSDGKWTRSWERPAAFAVTMVSLLICAMLIGTCAALLPQASSDSLDEGSTGSQEMLEYVAKALLEFQADCGRFPTDREGLGALLTDIGQPGWDGPYLDSSFADSWEGVRDSYGTPLRYRQGGLRLPVVVSAGRDRVFQTDIDSLKEDDYASGDDEIIWIW